MTGVRAAASPSDTPVEAGVGILIVDDDPAKLVALRSVLEPLGENIVEARSGADALRHLLKWSGTPGLGGPAVAT